MAVCASRRLIGTLFQALHPCCNAPFLASYPSRLHSNDSRSFDAYKVLELEPGVSLEEIRSQYVKLSKKYHPDYNPGDEVSEEKFISLTKAYRSLVEKVRKENPRNDGRNQGDNLSYEFTVEPLGIETEAKDPVSISRSLAKVFVLSVGLFFLVGVFKNAATFAIDDLREWSYNKNVRDQEKRIAEETRQAIIDYHRQHKKMKELYEKASR